MCPHDCYEKLRRDKREGEGEVLGGRGGKGKGKREKGYSLRETNNKRGRLHKNFYCVIFKKATHLKIKHIKVIS